MTRLAEEVGELATEVNHMEGVGVKLEKHGSPDRKKMAKEVQDVLRAALQVVIHYDLRKVLEQSINNSYANLK